MSKIPSMDDPTKCQACGNDAIGTVSYDPYDSVSGSPLVTSHTYCLSCYNLRVLAVLEFIRREK